MTLGLIGWAVSRHMQSQGKNPVLWFIAGAAIAFFGIVLLIYIPFFILLILLGAFLYYYNYSEPVPQKKHDPNTIEVKAERIDPQAKFNRHEWFYLDKTRKQHGPVSFHELKHSFKEKKIDPQTYVWNETMPEWKRVSEMDELYSVLA